MAENEKTQGRVEIRIGNVSFSAEGDQKWLGEQLGKVIEAVSKTPTLMERQVTAAEVNSSVSTTAPAGGSLASYLKAKGGDNRQVQRFLAAAAWIFKRGNQTLTTAIVAKALSEHHQKGLANPADCLNQNVSKGYCEKKKDGGFFITPEGWKTLGEEP